VANNHIEVENKRVASQIVKKYVVFFANENTPEGTEEYVIVNSKEEASEKVYQLIQSGCRKFGVFVQVPYKIQL